MTNLLMVLIGIGLFALLVFAGISYINPTMEKRVTAEGLVQGGVESLSGGYASHVAAAGSAPSSLAEIAPGQVQMPGAPAGMSWSYTAGATYGGGTGDHICLSGASVDEPTYSALTTLTRQYPSDRLVLSTAGCGATSAAAPSGYPTAMALTYWVRHD